jgi:hypothetical protein
MKDHRLADLWTETGPWNRQITKRMPTSEPRRLFFGRRNKYVEIKERWWVNSEKVILCKMEEMGR